MKITLTFLFPLLLLGAELAYANAQVCSNLLSSGEYLKILSQADKLNPALLDSRPISFADLFVKLKEEQLVAQLPEDLAVHLRKFSRFQLATVSAPELRQFYLNSIYALSLRVAELWRRQEARAQVGSVMSAELENFAMRLLDTFFSPVALNDIDLRPERAKEYFQAKAWMRFPWIEAVSAVSRFNQSGLRSYEFPRWYEANGGRILNWNQANRVMIALARANRHASICCLSEPGCAICPHNRRWRK